MNKWAWGGSFGRHSKHCFSLKELAMKDDSFWISGWSWLSSHQSRAWSQLSLTKTMDGF